MNLKKYISAAALLLCIVASAQTRQQKVSQQALVTAVQLYQDGKMQEAYSLLKQADAINPDNDAVHYYMGNIAVASNDGEKALEHYRKAYSLDSTNVWYGQRLASLLYAMRMPQQALTIYESLNKRRPYDLDIISAMMDVCIMVGENERADSLLSRIETLHGENDYSRLTRIEILRQQGRFPEFFGSLKEFFRTAGMQGGEKTEILDKVIKSSDPRFNYVHLKDYAELTDICLEQHPLDTAVVHYAAGFYYSTDRKAKALELCNKWPRDIAMVEMAIAIYYNSNDYEGALKKADDFAALAGSNKEMFVRACTIKGDCYQYLGQSEKAFKEYEAALKVVPDDANILNNYAYFLVCENQKIGKAAKMSKKAIELEPGNASYLDTYAWILHRQKKYKQAKVYFKKALLYGGKDSATVLEHYAQTLDALGEHNLAKAYREQAAIKGDK